MEKQTKIEAFKKIYAERSHTFTRFAKSYVYTHDIAEDIVMDSFMYYWENIDTIEPGNHIDTYLLTIIKNKCLNYLKRLQKQREIGEHLLKMETWELEIQIATLEACNPEKLFSKEIQHIIHTTIMSFPEQTREIFIRSRYKNQSNKEIAEALGLSLKSVEYHMTKALKALKVALQDYFPVAILMNFIINNI